MTPQISLGTVEEDSVTRSVDLVTAQQDDTMRNGNIEEELLLAAAAAKTDGKLDKLVNSRFIVIIPGCNQRHLTGGRSPVRRSRG